MASPQPSEDKDLASAVAAFEVYYALGINRTAEDVAARTGDPLQTVVEWLEIYSWDQHCQERIEELQAAFSEQFHTQTMGIRSQLIGMVEAALNNVDAVNYGVPFDITSVKDFRVLASAYETMVRANALAIQFGDGAKGAGREQTWADLLKSVPQPGD